jgi:D-hydroxyproline dehydrogenase subunit alpha
MTTQADLAVVGAGPAGLAAALEASRAGASVVLIDEYARPGGQYFKQVPEAFRVLDRARMGRDYSAGQELMARLRDERIELMADTLVWGAFEPGVLEIFREGRCRRVRAERVVVATGAYDRPVAFPGWTLPGVMTAGAAQTLVKSQWVLPGQRVLLAGSGPFQLPVAAQLIKAGAQVVGVLEASRVSGWLTQVPSVWRHLDKVNEARDYLGTMVKARVPYQFGWTVVEARGEGRVEQAVVAQLDEAWRPVPGTERVLDVDTICIGFGFLPSLQLARLLGCASRWDADLVAWATDHDADQRTSVEGVFVAGETTGTGGHDVAMGEGAIAGVMAAVDLGKMSSNEAEARLRKVRDELGRDREFAGFLNRTFSIRPGIYGLMREDTVVCRCEGATAGEVARVAREWNGSLRTIKQATRAGMGPCQGRVCGSLVAQIASRESGRSVEELGVDTPRPPIKPVPLGAMAAMGDEA